jgi:glycosyltransferase involved in cell wall biosynthesis
MPQKLPARPKLLLLMQLPPPVHGASLMNSFVAESKVIAGHFNTRIIPLRFITDLKEMGGFSIRKIILMLRVLLRIVGQMIAFRPQIVYYTIVPKGFAFYRDAFLISFIRLFRPKLIFHLHSRGIQNSIAHNSFRRKIYQHIFRNVHVICLSETLRHELDHLRPKTIFILPNGIPDQFYPLTKKPAAKPDLIFLANLFHAKGIYIFIEMLEILKKQGLEFSGTIIGNEGDVTLAEIREMTVKKNLTDEVTISGAIYGERKYEILHRAAIFINPSYDEAFPLTILEALQASLPVIASSVGGIPDIISPDNNIGILCEAGNVAAFADAAGYLISNPVERIEMGRRGRKEYEEKYSMAQFENGLLNILQKIPEQ